MLMDMILVSIQIRILVTLILLMNLSILLIYGLLNTTLQTHLIMLIPCGNTQKKGLFLV